MDKIEIYEFEEMISEIHRNLKNKSAPEYLNKEIVRLYAIGYSISDIEEELIHSKIKERLIDLGIKLRPEKKKKTVLKEKILYTMVSLGCTLLDLQNENIYKSEKTLIRKLKEMNIYARLTEGSI
jgi:hypothetical protein